MIPNSITIGRQESPKAVKSTYTHTTYVCAYKCIAISAKTLLLNMQSTCTNEPDTHVVHGPYTYVCVVCQYMFESISDVYQLALVGVWVGEHGCL